MVLQHTHSCTQPHTAPVPPIHYRKLTCLFQFILAVVTVEQVERRRRAGERRSHTQLALVWRRATDHGWEPDQTHD